MLAPLSLLKDYVDIKSDPETLGLRLTEIGLGTEKIEKKENDTVFEFEITPNRPDLLSIIGIAREVAAVENTKVKYPKFINNILDVKPKRILLLKIKTDYKINPRFTGIIIDGVSVKDSPDWLKEKLLKIGQRPINNIVDITNFVMYELGNPLHTFDYNKIAGQTMAVEQTASYGEVFTSVDGITYHLPKDAVVIRDEEKIIDLCGIKGGENSGTHTDTKTVFLRVPVEVPALIRRASQALSLRSDASSIFERAVDSGGTIRTLNRAVDLILELAGGEIASALYDLKNEDFEPWKLQLRLNRLQQILGIEIPKQKVIEILDCLNLNPKINPGEIITCLIPTYRNDLRIEEDLIEEVARIYGYNKFPKTLPTGEIPVKKIPYHKDYKIDDVVRNLLKAAGFSEIYTYSLISEKDLQENNINSEHVLRIDTPVSREYEYLRPNLKINLRKALSQNKTNFASVNLFELGKVYLGENIDAAKEEYHLAGITNSNSFLKVKGVLERIFKDLGIEENPTTSMEMVDDNVYFEINYDALLEESNLKKKFIPIAKYPPVIEDLAVLIPENILIGKVIETIKNESKLIIEVSILDKFKDTTTFHIIYQDPERNLTNEEVSKIRERIISSLKEKFKASIR